MLEYKGIKISWLGHSAFLIKNTDAIYIDPFQISPKELAKIILITHEHYDHCSVEDVQKIVSDRTVIVTTPECKNKLSGINVDIRAIRPGDKLSLNGIDIEAAPAYNINKFRSPGVPFHPESDGKVGFIITVDGIRIYHAGDTDFTPAMQNIRADIAFLPVSGTYVMTAEEAAQATKAIKPKLAVPMHYGSIVGSEKDAVQFMKLAKCEVKILEKE